MLTKKHIGPGRLGALEVRRISRRKVPGRLDKAEPSMEPAECQKSIQGIR